MRLLRPDVHHGLWFERPPASQARQWRLVLCSVRAAGCIAAVHQHLRGCVTRPTCSSEHCAEMASSAALAGDGLTGFGPHLLRVGVHLVSWSMSLPIKQRATASRSTDPPGQSEASPATATRQRRYEAPAVSPSGPDKCGDQITRPCWLAHEVVTPRVAKHTHPLESTATVIGVHSLGRPPSATYDATAESSCAASSSFVESVRVLFSHALEVHRFHVWHVKYG
mmetsp:Transcript_31408/g.100920  ORF Transcript_31408/g.100920 Transcript_31408/m.100920 type:complete len:224 (+) Transcript_31408:629-1300(+)